MFLILLCGGFPLQRVSSEDLWWKAAEPTVKMNGVWEVVTIFMFYLYIYFFKYIYTDTVEPLYNTVHYRRY